MPELRFAGFDGEWESKKVRELADFYSGGTPTSSNSKYYSGSIPFIRSGEIHKDSTELKISEDGLKNSSAKLVCKGDLLYALYGATSGEADISRIDGAINQAILAIKVNEYVSKKFLLNFFNYRKNNILSKYLQGGQGNLSAQIIKNLNIELPYVSEQEKIGDLFSKIDQLIEGQQELVDQTMAFKKSMLQKMFPKKDSFVPEFRFDGFENDWLKIPLKSSVKKDFKGKAMLDKLSPGNNEYLDTDRLNGKSQFLVDNASDTDKNDILILWDGSRAGSVYTGFEGVLGSTLRAYKIKDNSNPYFIYSYLIANQELIMHKYRTPNIPHVVKDFSEIFMIFKTSLEEQEKIGNFFKKLDEKVSREEKLLDVYKDMKKSLLQKMFV